MAKHEGAMETLQQLGISQLAAIFSLGTVLFAATLFLWGYFKGWSQTPHWMAVGYGMMALVCVVETFGYMTSSNKFLVMGLEYLAYVIILFILHNPLFRSQHFQKQQSYLKKSDR